MRRKGIQKTRDGDRDCGHRKGCRSHGDRTFASAGNDNNDDRSKRHGRDDRKDPRRVSEQPDLRLSLDETSRDQDLSGQQTRDES